MDIQRSLEILNILKPTDNMFYSPISLGMALSLYSKIIEDGTAKNEIKEFVGQDYSNYRVRAYSYNIQNVLWLDKRKNFDTSGIPFMVREIDMSNPKATQIKNMFVNEFSNGFMKSTPTEFNDLTVMDLMNIVYFNDTWNCGKLSSDDTQSTFHNFDGTTTAVKYLKYSAEYYFENDTCYIVPLRYSSGLNCYIVYPKNDIIDVDLSVHNIVRNEIKVKFPGFESTVNFDVTDFTSKLGMPSFSDSILTFDKEFSIPYITHSAKINVNAHGTEAAAVTEICRSRGISFDKPKELVFDKPFLYFISDGNDDTLFMGRLAKL